MRKILISLFAIVLSTISVSSFGTTITVSADADKTWQSSYSAFLKKEAKSENADIKAFSIYDLDKNGVPELIFSTDEGKVSPIDIYTYKNGNMIEITIDEDEHNDFWSNFGIIRYSPETRTIVNFSTGTGVWNTYYTLKNDKLVKTMDTGLSGVSIPPGEWNGEQISEFELYSRLWKKYPKGMITLGDTFGLSDVEIKCAIYGYDDYKVTYKNFLGQLMKNVKNRAAKGYLRYDVSFAVKDINGDKTPELMVYTVYQHDWSYSQSPVYTSVDIYSHESGRLQELISISDNGTEGGYMGFKVGFDSKKKKLKFTINGKDTTETILFDCKSDNRIYRKYDIKSVKNGKKSHYYYSLSDIFYYMELLESSKNYKNIAKIINKYKFLNIGSGYSLNVDNIDKCFE